MVSPGLPLAIGAAATLAQRAVIVPASVDFATSLAQATARLGAGRLGAGFADQAPGGSAQGATAGLPSSAVRLTALRDEARAALRTLHAALRRVLAENHVDASSLTIDAHADGRITIASPHPRSGDIEQFAFADREVSAAISRVVKALGTLQAATDVAGDPLRPATSARLVVREDGIEPQGLVL